jgi:protein ImuB
MYCCLYAPGNLPVLLDCARHFSPMIEENPDMVVFDIRGLESLHGPPASVARAIERQIGILAGIAIASNPDAAIHAARGIEGTTVIELGCEAPVLAPLSINLLGGSQDAARSLDLWGIRTFGAFAALPASGVAARLGAEGIALQRLARGEGYRRLRTQDDPPSFDAEMELDSPVELLESLCFVLARLLEEVLAKLSSEALATNEIRVTLSLERAPEHMGTLRLPVPMSDAHALLKMLHLQLAENPPSQGVVKVRLDAEPVRPRRTQHGLFAALPPEAERLETTLARVRHLVGSQNVGSPQLVDTHRPDAFVMRPFAPPQLSLSAANGAEEAPLRLCLRRFRPPPYAHVMLSNQRPVHVSAAAVTGRVAMAKGPWRSSGDWWGDDPWQRDRWDVALDSGVLLRIFEQTDSGRWFIEGSYD